MHTINRTIGKRKCKVKKNFKVMSLTLKPLQIQITNFLEIIEIKLVITVAPHKLICP
jgi:hypothetical protein